MNISQLRSHRLENHIQAFVLILGMALIMSLVGYALGGRVGVWLAIAVSIASLLFGASASPHAMLQIFRARPISPQKAPELYELFRGLASRAQLSHEPVLYYVPTRQLNAFAVGGERGTAVAVTDGLLRMMSERELAGIFAHELSHLRFGDTQLMALGQVFSRMTAAMSQVGQFLLILSLPAALMGAPFISFGGLLVLLLAPLACTLLQLALSRSREFNADLGAIEITGDPAGLASGLEKLEQAQRSSWFERLFRAYRVMEPNVLRTHPATEERIERLRQMAADTGVVRPTTQYDQRPAANPVAASSLCTLLAGLFGPAPAGNHFRRLCLWS
jgi:heat shock protein HtpX